MSRTRSLAFATLGALAALGLGLASGCAAQRELRIDSDPPGALVRLDDEIVGWTPFVTTFHDYGTRRITLYHEGYRSASRLVELKPPWYGRFPFDIFSEILIPVGWRDHHPVSITMEAEGGEVTEPDLRAVLERADLLRMATPEGPLPLPPKVEPQDGD